MLALGFVLELGLTFPIECVEDIEDRKACIQDIVDWQRTEIGSWELDHITSKANNGHMDQLYQ